MNKSDLTAMLAERADIPKVHAARHIDLMVDIVKEALVAGEKVTISDFGTFKVSQRRGFDGHNPISGGRQDVPARRVPNFKAGKGFKQALNPEDS